MQGFATKYIIQCAHPLSPQNGNRLWKQVLILLVACCFAMNKHLHPPRASLTPNKPQPTGMVSIIRAHSDMRAKSKKRLLQHLSLLKFSWAKAIALWFLDLIAINYLKCQVILAGSFHLEPAFQSPGRVIRHCGCLILPNFVDVQPPKWWQVWIPATTCKFLKERVCLYVGSKKIQQQVLGVGWPSRLEASVVSSEDPC